MLTGEQLSKTSEMLAADFSPEQVAQELQMSRTTFMEHLRDSGYRIRTRKVLEAIIPVPMHSGQEVSLR